jgi:hypothetical protein
MGSAYIQVAGYGKTASEAFSEIVSEDQYENGRSYSGTIGSSRQGFTMVSLDQKKFTKAAIRRWLDKAEETASKYEPISCLELPQSYAKGYGRGVRKFMFVGDVPE